VTHIGVFLLQPGEHGFVVGDHTGGVEAVLGHRVGITAVLRQARRPSVRNARVGTRVDRQASSSAEN
jgi:hypothetical protein